LGIREIRNFNIALLAKWKWRLGMEDKGLWREVLESKYGSWRNLNEIVIPKSASRWWKDIHKVCGSSTQGAWFENCKNWVIGKGDKVLFWEDLWVGDAPLSSRFYRLYLISKSKQSSISRVGHWVDNTWVWELVWRRQRLVWEQAMEA